MTIGPDREGRARVIVATAIAENLADQGHFSMVFVEAASYLEPFRDRA